MNAAKQILAGLLMQPSTKETARLISVFATLATSAQPKDAKRVCMMCDRYVTKVECEFCGADTERIQ